MRLRRESRQETYKKRRALIKVNLRLNNIAMVSVLPVPVAISIYIRPASTARSAA
jgi:hypothetical protein